MTSSDHVLEAHRLVESTVDTVLDLGVDEDTLEALGQQCIRMTEENTSKTSIALALAAELVPSTTALSAAPASEREFRHAGEVVQAASALINENDTFLFAIVFIMTFRGAISDAVRSLSKLGLKVDRKGLEAHAEFVQAREHVQQQQQEQQQESP